MMNKQYLAISGVAMTVVLVLLGTSSAYAINGHGSNWGPTFGGLNKASMMQSDRFTYNDGLKINSATFDISKPGVTISTQTLYVGAHNTITIKIYENGGPYYIMGGAMFLNIKGTEPKVTSSDTYVQWDKFGGVTVKDPHKILGDVKVWLKNDQHFKYVTFSFTPKSPMTTSDIIFNAWDLSLSSGTTTVVNAINIVYVPQGYH
jgi:hypothetical protein